MMNNFITFSVGVATGACATYLLLKDRYERKIQEDIESVRKEYNKTFRNEVDKPTETVTKEKPDIMEYAAKLREENYTSYSDTENKTYYSEKVHKDSAPYIIDEQDFGEEYDTCYLTYYKEDDVLARDSFESDPIVEDPDELLGDNWNNFNEDETVYIRDDELKIDYEIALDARKYSEVNP